MTGLCALEKPVVALRVEQPLFIKPRFLELVINIGGDDETVFVLHEFQQLVVNGFGSGHKAVVVDMPAPVGPMFLLGGKRIETGRVHVGEAVFFDKIGKVLLEALAGIGEARRGGESCAGTYHHGIGGLEGLLKFFCLHNSLYVKCLLF